MRKREEKRFKIDSERLKKVAEKRIRVKSLDMTRVSFLKKAEETTKNVRRSFGIDIQNKLLLRKKLKSRHFKMFESYR